MLAKVWMQLRYSFVDFVYKISYAYFGVSNSIMFVDFAKTPPLERSQLLGMIVNVFRI